MELFSIKNLKDYLLKSGFIKEPISQSDLLFIDKCNWFLGAIIRKNYAFDSSFENYVNINSKTLKRILGNNYKKLVIPVLHKLNLIEINEKYSNGRFSKSYCLTKFAIDQGIIKIPILSDRFKNFHLKYTEDKFSKIYADPLVRKIYNNLARLRIFESFDHYVEQIVYEEKTTKFRLGRYEAFYKVFPPLNETSTPLNIFKSTMSFEPNISQYGRVYHLGASIPKLIRESLRLDTNELLYEVDMASAQPSLLFLEWFRRIEAEELGLELELTNKELSPYFKLVINGEIYSYITQNSGHCSKLSYEKMKKEVLSALNGKHYTSQVNKDLKKVFPSFMKWINHLKKTEGHEYISRLSQKLESNLFITVFKELPHNIFCLPIHDCLLTTKEHTEFIRNSLITKIIDMYPFLDQFKLNKLFRIGEVSIPDESSGRINYEKIAKEMYEDRHHLQHIYEDWEFE